MRITVIGGGNIGTLMAAEAAAKGHMVTVYTSRPDKWNNDIDVLDYSGKYMFTGCITTVTNSVEEAVSGADHIWVTVPANMFSEISATIEPYMSDGQCIGIIPGSGGAEFAFEKNIRKGSVLYGLQRVHSIARLEQYGKSVRSLGRKNTLCLGAVPACRGADMSLFMEQIFDIPCKILPNYLSVTLTPSNPILHTTRLYSMFRNYIPGMVYPDNILFYENWDISSSEILLACDSELQILCKKIPLELIDVISLGVYYESRTPEQLTSKIKSISAFRHLTSPMKKTDDGWIPDWESRYFTADFSYGLKIIKDIAGVFSVDVPNITEVWKWYLRTSENPVSSYFTLDTEPEKFLEMYK